MVRADEIYMLCKFCPTLCLPQIFLWSLLLLHFVVLFDEPHMCVSHLKFKLSEDLKFRLKLEVLSKTTHLCGCCGVELRSFWPSYYPYFCMFIYNTWCLALSFSPSVMETSLSAGLSFCKLTSFQICRQPNVCVGITLFRAFAALSHPLDLADARPALCEQICVDLSWAPCAVMRQRRGVGVSSLLSGL